MSTTTDCKWITEGPDFAFTDDERWEVTASGDGFSLRENLAYDDPDGGDPDWEPVPAAFATMNDAKAHADTRQV